MSPFHLAAVTVAALATHGAAMAQATVKPDGQWRSSLGLGASLSSGNTKAQNLSFTGDGIRATATDKTSLFGNVQYARSGSTILNGSLRPTWFA